MKKLVLFIIAVLALCTFEPVTVCAGSSGPRVENGYIKREVKIAMRDGVKLHTTIYQPVDCGKEGMPIIMRRTPYSCAPYGEEFRSEELFDTEMAVFTKHNYIVVYQDVRGRYESEGSYKNIRPLSDEVNDATDTYDTIAWLVENTPNNGNVGMCGISYPGYYSTVGALCGHPALKACSPQAPIGDWFIGDDIHHNGAYMLLDTDDFGSYIFADREAFATGNYKPEVDYGESKYDYYCRLHTTKNIIQAYGNEEIMRRYYPFWYEIINHPDYDDFWKSVAHLPYVKNVKPAMLVVGALFDAEDCYGAIETYRTLLRESPETEVYYLNGPWIHGSWKNRDYDHLGAWNWGPGLFDFFYNEVEYPFFAHYLEGSPEKPAPVTLIPSFATGDSTARWSSLKLASLPYFSKVRMPLQHGDSKESSYVSDPAKPLRYLHPSKKNVRDRSYMADNYVDDSTAFVNFDYQAVDDTLFLCGPVDVDLYYRTSGEDLDFIVKVLDVTPDGAEMLIRGDVFRARYAHGFDKPRFLTPGKKEHLQFTLNDVVHYVLPGHHIRVQIQSSWFPLIDINPQTAVPNIYKAEESDYKSATVTILHGPEAESSISLPVVNGK